jgi:pimeloyl-ACP methyl ester carboxylesterase
MNYTSVGSVDAWDNRSHFTEALSKYFQVVRVNLPGFGGQKDPQTPWIVDYYAEFFDGIVQDEKPDYILGYSFGGAVVLRWKKVTGDTKIKTFLISPAIIRRYEKKDFRSIQKMLKAVLPSSLISLFRDFYLTRLHKNLYYSKATKVMRETYRNIVVVDLRNDLLEILTPITLIYGERDTATPVELVKEVIPKSRVQHTLHVISDGGHDIANTHTSELVSLIVKELEV